MCAAGGGEEGAMTLALVESRLPDCCGVGLDGRRTTMEFAVTLIVGSHSPRDVEAVCSDASSDGPARDAYAAANASQSAATTHRRQRTWYSLDPNLPMRPSLAAA